MRLTRHLRQVPFCALMLLIGSAFAASAQPMELQQSDAPLEELKLAPDDELGGRSALVQGTADALGVRYYALKIDVMSPTVIRVFADDPAMPVKVSLHRHLWDKPDAEAETDSEGNYEFTGRLDDTIGIWLKAEEPSAFHLMVWTGDPVPVEVPPIFFDANGQPIQPPEEE